MPFTGGILTPGLDSFKKSVRSRGTPVETSIENLIALLKRRQIRNSRPCAIATAWLLRRVVETFKFTDVAKLIERVQHVGQRLIIAQPRELAIGNIVRRVLGVIRDETEEGRDGEASSYSDAATDSRPQTPREPEFHPSNSPSKSPQSHASSPLRHEARDAAAAYQDGLSQRPLLSSHLSYATTSAAPSVNSMFNLLQHPQASAVSLIASPGSRSPGGLISLASQSSAKLSAAKDLKAEVVEGIQEILEELKQADDQIAGYALEYIHSNEIVLAYSSSTTVKKFLLKAAAKRKFTVIHAEAYPNNHDATHASIIGNTMGDSNDDTGTKDFEKTLTAAGITVIVIPDSAVFALMSRVNKVILSTHIVLANGGLIAAAGSRAIAKAAKLHSTPVVVLSGIYKLSPVYPFDVDALMENGDPTEVASFEDASLVGEIGVENPLFDYVPVDLVDLYITNLGGHAPSYLHCIINDHYRTEDVLLDRVSLCS